MSYPRVVRNLNLKPTGQSRTLMPSPVGICGYKGAGKTTAALALRAKDYRSVPFTLPLKRMLLAFGLSEEQINGRLKESPTTLLCGKTPRWAMQSLGVEWGHKLIHEDIWLAAWEAEVERSNDEGDDPVVVDDLRFHNEARRIIDLGGIIIYISREGCGPSDHSTETEAARLYRDFVIVNDQDLEYIDACIGGILECCTRTPNNRPGL